MGFPAASETEYEFLRTIIEDRPDPRRCHHPGAHPVPPPHHSKDLRGHRGRQKRGGPPLQLHLLRPAAAGLPEEPRTRSWTSPSPGPSCSTSTPTKCRRPTSASNTPPRASPARRWSSPCEICNAVIDVWKPRPERKVIINLPSTVEMSMPHVYAQQIEYMSEHLHTGRTSSSPSTPTTTGAPPWPTGDWPCWPGASGSRAPSSATASAPATWTSSPWP